MEMVSTTTIQPARPEELPDLDVPALLERCMGEAETAGMLLGMFEERLPDLIAEIASSLAQPYEPLQVARKVHVLKGNAGELAAMRLHAAASRLEDALRAAQLDKAPALLDAVEQATAGFLRSCPSAIESLT